VAVGVATTLAVQAQAALAVQAVVVMVEIQVM